MGFRTFILLVLIVATSTHAKKFDVGAGDLSGSIQLMNPTDTTVKIEGTAKNSDTVNYIAIGIGKDLDMTEDIGFVCRTGGTEIVKIAGRNRPTAAALKPGQMLKEGVATYDAATKTLKCTFEIPTEIGLADNDPKYDFKLKESKLAILIGTGGLKYPNDTGNMTIAKHSLTHMANFDFTAGGGGGSGTMKTTATSLLLVVIGALTAAVSLLKY